MGFLARVFGSMSGFTALDKATQNALDEIAARASQGLSEFTITIREFDVPRLPLDHTVTAITEAIQDNGHSVLSTRKEVRSGVARLLVRPAPPGTVPARTTGGTRSSGVIATIGLEDRMESSQTLAVAFDPQTHSAYVCCWNDSAIFVIDTIDNVIKATISTLTADGAISSPFDVAVDPVSGTAYIIVGGDVRIVDTRTNDVKMVVDVDARKIDINLLTHTAYILTYPRSLTVLDLATCQVTATVDLGGVHAVNDVAVDSVTNQVYALLVGDRSTEICVVDTTSNRVKTRFTVEGSFYDLVVDPMSSTAYTAGMSGTAGMRASVLVAIDTRTNRETKRISLATEGWNHMPAGLAVDTTTGFIYVTNAMGGNVWVVDAKSKRVVGDIKTGERPGGICMDVTQQLVVVGTGLSVKTFSPMS